MRWMRRAAVSFLSVVALAAPAQAAVTVIAPPGKAGADQYFETIPSSGGNVAPPAGGGGGSHPGPALATLGNGRAGARGLARLGKDGQAAAALAAATAPASGGQGSSSAVPGAAGTGRTSSSGAGVPDAGGSAAGGLVNALTGSDAGGIGLFLPVALLLTLLVAIGARFRRPAAGR